MKLFLTSVASRVMDKFVELEDLSPSDFTVAFIPTAADIYENKWFIEEDRKKLTELGFNVIDVSISEMTEQEVEEKLKNIDIVFVAGGNTFYLLEKVIKSGFDKIIKKSNFKYYIGSSAGSAIVGLTIEPVKNIDDPSVADLKSYEGIKLIDKIILPHFNVCKDKIDLDSLNTDDVIKLNDDEALVVDDNRLDIIHS